MLTEHRLKELLRYDADTGMFYRMVTTSPNARAGSLAGNKIRGGYMRMSVDGHEQYAHRLAFLYMTGKWPTHHVDHINGDKADNRWCNLRPATPGENMQNKRSAQSNNQVGLLGVSPKRGKFTARIGVGRKYTNLGVYTTAEEAQAAYLKAKSALHPYQTITDSPT